MKVKEEEETDGLARKFLFANEGKSISPPPSSERLFHNLASAVASLHRPFISAILLLAAKSFCIFRLM